MPEYKTGERLRSQVSAVNFVVVRADGDTDEIQCDGVAFAREGDQLASGTTPSQDGPKVEIGKRYENEAGTVELLCVTAGVGQVSLGAEPLRIKVPKPLPASD